MPTVCCVQRSATSTQRFREWFRVIWLVSLNVQQVRTCTKPCMVTHGLIENCTYIIHTYTYTMLLLNLSENRTALIDCNCRKKRTKSKVLKECAGIHSFWDGTCTWSTIPQKPMKPLEEFWSYHLLASSEITHIGLRPNQVKMYTCYSSNVYNVTFYSIDTRGICSHTHRIPAKYKWALNAGLQNWRS